MDCIGFQLDRELLNDVLMDLMPFGTVIVRSHSRVLSLALHE
jgi:hypothetical protein